MDDFIDPFLSSPSWAEMSTSSRSSWVGTVASQTNGLLSESMEAYKENDKNSAICMIPSGHMMENVAAEDMGLHAHDDTGSIFADGNLKYLSQHKLSNRTSHPSHHDNETHESNFSLKGVFDSHSTAEAYVQELNTSCSVSLPHSALTISSSIESNGSEPSKFPQSLGDAHSISSVPTMWPASYSGVSSFIEQGKLQNFGLQGIESDADILTQTYVENGKYPHLNNSVAASLQDCNELHTSHLPTFNLGQQMKMTSGGLQPLQQEQNELHDLPLSSFAAGPQMTLSKNASTEGNGVNHHTLASQQQATQANGSGCNGAAKPRVRARRGQATDPHSIAERLRREKIAERMKNLQELVPNSNKTDKASMLDEIIDYVKFLQLQVKVLSMSRLGAAGAVVPLITDVQAEGTGTLHLSSVGQGGADLSETEDNLAFEREVVKLMESNVTTAMQYLQNKGLCLMPIALAAAISSQKGTSSAAIPPDRRKPDTTNGAISHGNGQSLAERNAREDGFNSCNGGGVKQEETLKSI